MTPNELAEFFHERYEALAPTYGYETKPGTAKPWNEIEEDNNNKRLMIAVCTEVLKKTNKDSGMGVALGLLLWGLIFLVFPKFTNAIGVVSWAFYAVGLVLFLIGVMGLCIEWGKKQSGKDTH